MSETVKQSLNRADLNLLADLFRNLKIGDVLRALPVVVRNQTPATDPSFPAGSNGIKLPDDAKSMVGGGSQNEFMAYARSGGATGWLKQTFAADTGAAPGTGEFCVTPAGDFVFAAADALVGVDIYYVPEKQDVVTLTLPVSGDVLTIPSTFTALGVVSLLSATVVEGSSMGVKVVDKFGATLSAGQASLDLAKSVVNFYPGEATKATVTLGVACAADVNALLEAVASYI